VRVVCAASDRQRYREGGIDYCDYDRLISVSAGEWVLRLHSSRETLMDHRRRDTHRAKLCCKSFMNGFAPVAVKCLAWVSLPV
jgi:hypothetical protein